MKERDAFGDDAFLFSGNAFPDTPGSPSPLHLLRQNTICLLATPAHPTRKIIVYFNENFLTENITDIYIQKFYDVSESTVIVYSIDNTRWFANADLGGRVYKPTQADDEVYDD